MNTTYYLCWVDDKPGFPESFKEHFEILKADYGVEFDIDEHTSTKDFDTIARNIGDELICFIDYNLKDGAGNGIDGNEVIKIIREYNLNCRIVFYSSNATQQQLQKLVAAYDNVTSVVREDLRHIFTRIAQGDL